jgi:hypothetical protein
MIKATNGAVGLEIERQGDIILFTGHLGGGIGQIKLSIWANQAWSIFDTTDIAHLYVKVEEKRCLVSAIDCKPQGTEIIFYEKHAVFVDSKEFEQKLKKILAEWEEDRLECKMHGSIEHMQSITGKCPGCGQS